MITRKCNSLVARTGGALLLCVAAIAGAQDYQSPGIEHNMPVFAPALKARMTYPMAWSPHVTNLPAWRDAGRAALWKATLQERDDTPFRPRVIAEQDRGTYVARQVVFNITGLSRVRALLLVPKAAGRHPAMLMLHDHGGKFDIGKEKMIEPFGDADAARHASAQAWADKEFSGRWPGDALAARGYVVLCADAVGWGDRGPLTGDAQQALASNFFNLGSSLAGNMALEDVRAADFLASLPEVDKTRVAALGFSMGAFRAWQVGALSDAISAVVAVNWMATADGLMVPGSSTLRGSSSYQMMHPGLLRLLDYPDVASLAAPKPTLFFAGDTDKLFPVASVRDAYAKMAKVWQAWGAADKFEAVVRPGGHEFPRDVQDYAYDWLDRQFGRPVAASAGKVCDVKRYGAKGDGVAKDTVAIQKAIDDCAAAGGGKVLLAGAPVYVSGPLSLKSHITLSIAAGTTLAGSEDHEDYPAVEELREAGRQALLSADNATDITIDGGGTIDGRGQSWWADRSPANRRPRLIVFRHASRILMEDITVQNSPSWQIVPYYSDHLTFRNMTIRAPDGISHNTDGIDPFSSSHVLIDHVTIDTGDDNVAIKSGQPNSPGGDAPSHDITIRDSTFLHGHGLSIGSEVAGGVYNVLAERIRFTGTGTGVRIKSNRDRGNVLKNLVYRDLRMEDVGTPILITEFYPKIPEVIDAQAPARLTPRFSDITIERVTATGAKQAAIIVGLPESPILALTLSQVHIDADKGAVVKYAHMTTRDFTVRAAQGKALMAGPDVEGLDMGASR